MELSAQRSAGRSLGAKAIGLGSCHAMSGTDVPNGEAISLGWCYTICGTDVAYGQVKDPVDAVAG
eukprot:3670474-Rhodomonas_salina.6